MISRNERAFFFLAEFHAWKCLRFYYEGNYGTRNAPEKFREFRETGPRLVLQLDSCEALD